MSDVTNIGRNVTRILEPCYCSIHNVYTNEIKRLEICQFCDRRISSPPVFGTWLKDRVTQIGIIAISQDMIT